MQQLKLRDEPYHATIEIVNTRCKGLGIIKDLGIKQCALVDVRNLPNGLTRHLIRFPSSEMRRIPKDSPHEMNVSRKNDKETFLWFDTEGCDVCRNILATNSFLVSGRKLKGSMIVYSFVAPTPETFKKVIGKLEESGLKPKIIEAGKLQPKGKTLTAKQDRVLWLALRMGYFEYPRKVHTSELSRRLGIGSSTLSETIRRGTRRLLEDHFES
jgi:hypothetical protein